MDESFDVQVYAESYVIFDGKLPKIEAVYDVSEYYDGEQKMIRIDTEESIIKEWVNKIISDNSSLIA